MDKGINWKQTLFTGFITALVTLGSWIGFYYWKEFKTKQILTYNIKNLIFEKGSENLGLYNIELKNKGKNIINRVYCDIKFETGSIEKFNIEPKLLSEHKELNLQRCEIKFPNINGGEKSSISILVSSKNKLLKTPKIILRGDGVLGKSEQIEKEKPSGLSSIFISLFGAFAGVTFFLRRNTGGTIIDLVDSDGQNHTLGYLCCLSDLPDEAERFFNLNFKTTYRAESERLTAKALKEPENADKIKNVLLNLLEYNKGVLKTSKGIIYLNIAKIEKAQGNEVKFKEYMERANDIIPELIEKRKKIDSMLNSELQA